MSLSLSELNRLVASVANPELAEDWDNVGLQAGDPASPVRRVLVALEASELTIAEAERLSAEAIVAHHPLIFRPINSAAATGRVGKALTRLIQNGIGLIVAHTNLDKSEAGPNHALAAALGVEIEGWLQPDARQENLKFVIFTPAGHERKMIDAIASAGGGIIGDYSHCSFRAPGAGTFLPLDGANPFIGKKGEFEQAEEVRLESVVPKRRLHAVLKKTLAAHPYEEPAYDIYPLEPGIAQAGLGIVGRLEKPLTLKQLRFQLRKRVRGMLPEAARGEWSRIQFVGAASRLVKRVAICSGACGSLAHSAASAKADCLITGEIGYHDAAEARARRLTVAAIGHFASEAAAMGHFAKILSEKAKEIQNAAKSSRRKAKTPPGPVEFIVAQSERDPIRELS